MVSQRDIERQTALRRASKVANATGKPVAVIYGPRGYYLTELRPGSMAVLRVFPNQLS